ncbi:DUF2244 domain-containing protein [Sinimarinibacterium sp. NLF-5-8]|uniref:DUF2244 domain-containing protein n=1 Tax=Sinimarinibacterium sp. NLF-5-8 TaxID=2698684 RepID=UPI00137B94B0|nr:DUF2244 domain-containing protein [Sinimarinibacterium sp. NLF-5-8]QHS10414.1 DUF2244 domain-containing protein [Sinimarinibacterium sp. NLF-5-8]
MVYNRAPVAALESVEARLVIQPNASLTVAQACWFMASMAVISLILAVIMLAQGLWLVIPFTSLELVALGAALYWALHKNRYREVLVFTPSHLRIERGMLGQAAPVSTVLDRARTRVLLERGAHRHAPQQVILSCMGRRLCIGGCLTDVERRRVATRIRELLIPGWCGMAAESGVLPTQTLRFGE